ncbi:hypothetical protein ACFLW7_02105 [Chloroflexota bacterium]
MKTRIKGKILSVDEFSRLLTTDDSRGITYSDIEKLFSSEDLKEYNRLGDKFVKLIGNKNNKEQWDMLLDPATGLDLVSILNRIEELRGRYNLPGTFHKIWRAKPLDDNKVEYDEVSW